MPKKRTPPNLNRSLTEFSSKLVLGRRVHILASERKGREGTRGEEPLLSVVIPAYNEEANIRRGTLRQVVDYLADQPYSSELLVVDDGSEDETASLVRELHPSVTLIRSQHQGKAASVRKGVLAARGSYVIFMDMDLATPVSYVDDCLAQLEAGFDVVIASREVKGARRLGDPVTRKLAAKAFNFLVRKLLLPDTRDSQCGFKGFRRQVAQDLFRSLVVFADTARRVAGPMVTAFDVELLLLAKKRGHRIKEIPVTWQHLRSGSVNLFKDAYRMLDELLRVYVNNLRGKYDRTISGR